MRRSSSPPVAPLITERHGGSIPSPPDDGSYPLGLHDDGPGSETRGFAQTVASMTRIRGKITRKREAPGRRQPAGRNRNIIRPVERQNGARR